MGDFASNCTKSVFKLSIARHLLSIKPNMIASMQEAKYHLAGKLKLQDNILCLHATDDGKLASGGDDCLLHLFAVLI